MVTRRIIIAFAAVAAILVSVNSQSDWWPFSGKDESTADQAEVTEIQWGDLIPADFVQPENPFTTMSREEIDKLMDGSDESNAELEKLQEVFNYAPVNEDLDGKRVKLPAYITPLEYEDNSIIKEFLLVPYVGACIHVPPPPANQIVHAQSEKGIKSKGMYEAVWATGIIRAETVKSALAESGYRLEVESIKPYTE